mmetsp:Transcript_29334/g.93896  ORF Transcript_29334/g.93896 Transcript_29334/m.93896 type:complete len:268 (+) Transcript_29334:290-1093(+)
MAAPTAPPMVALAAMPSGKGLEGLSVRTPGLGFAFAFAAPPPSSAGAPCGLFQEGTVACTPLKPGPSIFGLCLTLICLPTGWKLFFIESALRSSLLPPPESPGGSHNAPPTSWAGRASRRRRPWSPPACMLVPDSARRLWESWCMASRDLATLPKPPNLPRIPLFATCRFCAATSMGSPVSASTHCLLSTRGLRLRARNASFSARARIFACCTIRAPDTCPEPASGICCLAVGGTHSGTSSLCTEASLCWLLGRFQGAGAPLGLGRA